MATHEKPLSAAPTASLRQPSELHRVSSAELLRGHDRVEIDHGGQRYLLRVTRENKLILTK